MKMTKLHENDIHYKNVMTSPIPFLTSDADGHFTVSQEALEILQNVKAPLAVVVRPSLPRLKIQGNAPPLSLPCLLFCLPLTASLGSTLIISPGSGRNVAHGQIVPAKFAPWPERQTGQLRRGQHRERMHQGALAVGSACDTGGRPHGALR